MSSDAENQRETISTCTVRGATVSGIAAKKQKNRKDYKQGKVINTKILNFGSLNIDNVYRIDRFLRPGETRAVKSYEVYAGGKGLNQSIALARAGAGVYHAGAAGSDGRMLIEILKESGVNTEHILKTDKPGGHTVIQVDDSGQNTILLYGGTNHTLTEEYIDTTLSNFSKEDIVLLQNEVNLVRYIIDSAFDKGMKIAFNAAPADNTAKRCPIEKVKWLIINETEGCELTGKTQAKDIISVLQNRYPALEILLTLGADGCCYAGGGTVLFQDAFKVQNITDTTGAGDTFTGYFLYTVSQGLPVEKALQAAGMASALAIQGHGAASSIPRAAQVEKALKKYNESRCLK